MRASGEINFVRAPEQIPEGDEVTVLVSASARETGIDRTLALEFPDGWKVKRAWRVEAGSDHAVKIAPYSEVTSLLSKQKGQDAIALADYSDDFDPDADGIAYFIVFNTKRTETTGASTVKAALVERLDPDAPAPIDPKTKKPLPVDRNWRMVYPSRYDFSLNDITSKRLAAAIDLEHVPRNSRALVLDEQKAMGTFHARPEIMQEFFLHPFSLQFWFRTTGYDQDLLRIQSENDGELRIGIGLLGQPTVAMAGKNPKSVVTSKSIANDGVWHNLVCSKDSLGTVRIFFDGEPPATGRIANAFFKNIVNIAIGDSSKAEKDFSLDELHFLRGAYREPAEFLRGMTIAYRDTSRRAFAVFHFDDFTPYARSSVPETAPIYFSFDSSAALRETTSPVEFEPATLTAELLSPTTVNIEWQTTSELGVKQYVLERRVGGGGKFEKVLALEAKHGTKTTKKGQPIFSRATYHASENLPKMRGDIDLYYRVAIVGFNEKELPIYTYPIKLDYAPDRDIFVEQNEPNPFNPTTIIAVRLTKPETVKLSVFDMFGREVTTLANEKLSAGRHAYPLDATGWPPGIYFYKVQTAAATVTRKMVLLH
ncbi:MAG TPA: LamG-like jellyroll fold domain-containing protein [Candidatus Kapabacteria bacterium]